MYRILEILKEKDSFISGSDIGKSLGISRAAVWKGIKRLRNEGYEIEAVTNKGYRLVSGKEIYNEKELSEALYTKSLGRPLFFYKKTDSTNNALREEAQKGAPEGAVAVAEEMTTGRGRLGRSWEAAPDTGIWMSLLLKPDILPADASVLTLLAGLAVSRALEEAFGIEAGIKWPNDVLLKGKKLTGILTEMECEMQRIHFVIVGIGINVNTPSFGKEVRDKATSLYLEEGRRFSRRRLFAQVLGELEGLYDEFKLSGYSFMPFLEEYKKRCVTLNRQVRVMGREEFSAYAEDITPQGELVVIRDDNKKREVVFSGEVSVRGLRSYGE